MLRSSLVALALFAMLAAARPATADEYRGYQPYDRGWFLGHLNYGGYAWRDPAIAGEYARRPDFTQWSGFDKYALRLKAPVYRDPVHCAHRVDIHADSADGYVWPVRKDVTLNPNTVPCLQLDCDDDDPDEDNRSDD